MSLRLCRRIILCVCSLAVFFLLSALPVATSHHALALSSDSSITITSQSTSTNFPSSITFNVSARDSSSPIVSAEVVVDLSNYNGPETHQVPLGTPQRSVTLKYIENTSGDNFISPGTTINYYWRFADSAGTIYIQPQHLLTTVDTRFSWQHLNQGLLQVNWYARSVDFGQSILSQASSSIDRISANLGGGLQNPINLWVYETDSDFHGSLPPNAYEWVGGIAFPTLNEASIVVQGTADFTLIRDMPHELTHLIFHQLIGSASSAPTWFDEGLAVYNQGFHESNMTARFNQALASHTLLKLKNITYGFPANSDQAYLAYAQSWDLVQYMYLTFGQAKMIQFIKDLRGPTYDFDQAMQASLGVDVAHLEYQWLVHHNQPATPPPNQITPTPQITPQPTGQVKNISGTGASSGDDRSWVLILFGGILVAGSFVGLIALFVVMRRSRRTAAPTATPLMGQNGNSMPGFYSNPGIYTQNSPYMRPAEPSPPPHLNPPPAQPQQQPQQPQQPQPPVTSGQDYSSYRQGPRYPQAPQE